MLVYNNKVHIPGLPEPAAAYACSHSYVAL